MDALGLQREQIGFVAFAGWDAAGAKWFGYPTYWANRGHAPVEVLGTEPDRMAADLGGLASFAGR
jgi:2-haloacid dehalogenase